MLSPFQWSLFSSQLALISDNVHVTWTLLKFNPCSFPTQPMLRGPTKKLTTWLPSTLYGGGGGANSITAINHPNTFSMIEATSWWHHSYRPMCTHDRSQSREKRVHFESMCANTNVHDFFKKGFFLMMMYSLFRKKGIFLWFTTYKNVKS